MNGDRLMRFLAVVMDRGERMLHDAVAAAVKRHLSQRPSTGHRFLTDADLLALARAIAAVNAVSDLAGRYRIRKGLKADAVTFDERSGQFDATPLDELLAPREALDWFKRLMGITVPMPDLWDTEQIGHAFKLAVTTDETVRSKVHAAIAERLETGKRVSDAPRDIEEILDEAGVSYKSGYGQVVFRTNAMEAYRAGSWKEMQDPDVQPFFACWQYLGIADGRERQGPYPKYPDHHRHFGKYFPMSVSFQQVRGTEARDVIHCRCDFRPVSKVAWRKLAAQGAVIESAW